MGTANGPALVTGVAGQDGILLARALLNDGRDVVGTIRPGSTTCADLAKVYLPELTLVEHDLRDGEGFARLLDQHAPAEIYNLASFSSVGASWGHAELVAETNAMAVLRMLEVLRAYADKTGSAPRFAQASTAEMFGIADDQPQTEATPHRPRSPYASAKSFAHQLTVNFRDTYGLPTCSAIFYNHESVLRPRSFVTRKITTAVAEIALGRRSEVTLGNLDVRRDWGAATDAVRALRLIAAHETCDDFIIATGIAHSLHDLLDLAFEAAGLDDPARYVRQDPALMRPSEISELRGDSSKAASELGWKPTTSFAETVQEMVRIDLLRVESGVESHPDYLLPRVTA